MLALPFFMLAGTLMLGGNLGRDLLDFASAGMLRWTGGPLSTTVVSSVAFGGVSGSAVANASALGSVLIPWQKRRGYPARLCAANNATSSVIDVLIPPSIPMILFSLVSGDERGRPVCCRPAARHADGSRFHRHVLVDLEAPRLQGTDKPATARCHSGSRVSRARRSLLPILIILGLRFGFATPTEIAVLSVVYSLLLSLLLYRDLTLGAVPRNMVEAGIATGVVMLVIMGSAVVGWLLTFDQVPTSFAEWVSATIQNKYLVILALNILMLIVGMPLDLPPSILLLGPIFVPLAAAIGLDPVQLGLIMVINLGIGLYTPPIGTTLFISSSIAKTSLSETTRELWPFLAVAMVLLLAVSYVPALTLY